MTSRDADIQAQRSLSRRPRLTQEAARTPVACTACRERKIKCSGNQPCQYCAKRNLRCVVLETSKRKLYSVTYVRELERRVALQDQFSGDIIPQHEPITVDKSTTEDGAGGTGTTLSSPRNNATNRSSIDLICPDAEVATPSQAGNSPIETDTVMSSSLNFSFRIKEMPVTLEAHRSRVKASKSSNNAYSLVIPHFSKDDASYIQAWPTEEESQFLLDTVLSSIGRIQHLFDSRTFADRLAAAYNHDELCMDQNHLWTTEMLMVFAVGKVLLGKLEYNESFPGEQFFAEAMNHLPNLCYLCSAGTLGIEILGLIAFYLQCADRKEDAYLYAGMALRTALLMGLHREGNVTPTTRSEKAHRNRLWWTIYMQERRLAAATGNPLSIQDEAIQCPCATDSPGFNPPDSLNTNIEIARVTGQILQIIYGQKNQTEQSFVTGVRRILSSLHEISSTMPRDLRLDFSRELVVTRSSATLYLMLYQAIILATRPVLLHLARESVTGFNHSILSSVPLHQLARTCIDAAQHSLDILCALKQQELIANFGFFDLDATFSVAFAFVLGETIYRSPHQQSGLYGIRGTLQIFQYLTAKGNKASVNRENDVMQMCDHLAIHQDRIYNARKPSIDTSTADNLSKAQEEWEQNNQYSSGTQPLQDNMVPPTNCPETPLHWVGDTSINEMFLGSETHDLYSLCNNDLPLAGTVETDWDVLERQILHSR